MIEVLKIYHRDKNLSYHCDEYWSIRRWPIHVMKIFQWDVNSSLWWKSITNDDLSTWLQLIPESSPLWWNFIIVMKIYYFYYENLSKYWISITEIRLQWWKMIEVLKIYHRDKNLSYHRNQIYYLMI